MNLLLFFINNKFIIILLGIFFFFQTCIMPCSCNKKAIPKPDLPKPVIINPVSINPIISKPIIKQPQLIIQEIPQESEPIVQEINIDEQDEQEEEEQEEQQEQVSQNIFEAETQVTIIKDMDLFVSLAYSLPSITSAADSFITSILSQQILMNFTPTFFQVNYIYSAVDNLANGNYKKQIISEHNCSLIKTLYEIPYKRDDIERIVKILTTFNIHTKILWYEIPREFSYDSFEQASVAYGINGNNFIGKCLIPPSFTNNLECSVLDFALVRPSNEISLLDTTMEMPAAVQFQYAATFTAGIK